MKHFKRATYGFSIIFLLSMIPTMVLAMTATNVLTQGSNGELDKGRYTFSSAPSGRFSHNYNFSLEEAFDTRASLTNLPVVARDNLPSVVGRKAVPGIGGVSSISGLEFSLFEAGGTTSLGSQRRAGPVSMISAQLPAGDYRFNVKGDSGGQYLGTLNLTSLPFVTPVPEASTWIMMIFGLGFVAFLLKNKNGASRKKLTIGAALPA